MAARDGDVPVDTELVALASHRLSQGVHSRPRRTVDQHAGWRLRVVDERRQEAHLRLRDGDGSLGPTARATALRRASGSDSQTGPMTGRSGPPRATMKHMEQVGIRSLKQNASAVVAGVAAGEAVTITDRGRPVALLAPIPSSPLQQLISSGRARPPRRSVADLPAPRPGPNLSAELATMRAAEGR